MYEAYIREHRWIYDRMLRHVDNHNESQKTKMFFLR